MAVWQYIAYLIPETSLADDGTMKGLVVTPEMFEHPPLQFSVAPAEVERLISGYLPARGSWHNDLRVWGDDSRDDVDIWYEGERIDSIRVRLDLRHLTRDRIARVVEIARHIGCCFLEGRTFQVIPATEEALLASIRNSRPAKFVADPHGFLTSLARDEPKLPEGH